MINAAATLRIFGYLDRAIIVNKLPKRPVNNIIIATIVANILSGGENLNEK